MNGYRRIKRSKLGRRTALTHICTVLVLGAWAAGCSEHRISLDEFVAMNQEMQQAVGADVSAESAALIDRELGPYRIGQGDVLGVSITSLEQAAPFPALMVRVDRDGNIDLPNVSQVKVAGLELEDVDKAIHNSYVPAVFRDVVVYATLVEPRTTNVLVRGAVALPGMVRLPRSERNLVLAITTAGGASDLASGKITLRRVRRPTEEVVLDLTTPQGVRAALSLDPLENGDIIIVHAAMPNMVFVGGLVNAPQPQAYPAGVGVTVLQAIAGSAGLRTDVFPKEATLTRHMQDGTDVHVKLNLGRIACGKDPNISLAAGDILWVPHTIATRIQEWVSQNVFFRVGASVNYNVSGIEFLNRASQQSRGNGSSQEQQFDPFGFLTRGAALRGF